MKQETFTDRFSLTKEIILKLYDSRSVMDSKKPLNTLFNDQWKEIIAKRWLPYEVAINLEEMLNSCGPFWLMKNLVDQLLNAKFVKDMDNTMDITFAIMHLNIEACTETLLKDILISMLFNKNQMAKITEPQSRLLAKLCIYAILSTMEAFETTPQKKRPRPDDDDSSSPMAKLRKTGIDSAVEGGTGEKDGSSSQQLKESLRNSLQELFKIFHQQVMCDELSPKVNFIFQFFSLLVQFEKSVKIKAILKLIPSGLIQNLLKLVPFEDLTFGFILR
jgi:mediator of RNA polymerase II transcription subunit 24